MTAEGEKIERECNKGTAERGLPLNDNIPQDFGS